MLGIHTQGLLRHQVIQNLQFHGSMSHGSEMTEVISCGVVPSAHVREIPLLRDLATLQIPYSHTTA